MAVVVASLASIGPLVCPLPARRAPRINPVGALRGEQLLPLPAFASAG